MKAMFIGSALISITAISMLVDYDRTRYPVQVRTHTFGGNGYEQGYSAQMTSDGGYILGGWTDSYGNGREDMILVKVNSDGVLEWQRAFGGASDDFGESVLQASDGGYVIGGYTYSFGAGGYDMFIVKTDSQGDLEWQRTFGGSSGDYCYSVQQTADGGYLLGGASRHSFDASTNMYVVKIDSKGDLEWENTYGGDENDGCYSIQQTVDGGYILAGDSKSFSEGPCDYDMYLVKIDSHGNLEWQRTFGGDSCDGCYSVKQTTDGGYVLAGDCESYGAGLFDVYLVKTDPQGKMEWQKTFGDKGWDDCYSVSQEDDGGFIMSGCSDSFGEGDFDMYLVKTDSQGDLIWQKTFGSSQNEYAYSVHKLPEGAYVLGGYTESSPPKQDDISLTYVSYPYSTGETSKLVHVR